VPSLGPEGNPRRCGAGIGGQGAPGREEPIHGASEPAKPGLQQGGLDPPQEIGPGLMLPEGAGFPPNHPIPVGIPVSASAIHDLDPDSGNPWEVT